MRGKYIHQESVSVLNLSEIFLTKWVYLSHETTRHFINETFYQFSIDRREIEPDP